MLIKLSNYLRCKRSFSSRNYKNKSYLSLPKTFRAYNEIQHEYPFISSPLLHSSHFSSLSLFHRHLYNSLPFQSARSSLRAPRKKIAEPTYKDGLHYIFKNNSVFKQSKDPQTSIIIKHTPTETLNSSLFLLHFSRFLITSIKKNKGGGGKNKFRRLKIAAYKKLKSILLHVNNLPHSQNILGIGFSFSGRVYGGKKAASFKILFGSVPFSTLNADLDYSQIMQKTRNGT